MIKIEKINEKKSVYDITVDGNNNFFANNILVHNCQEITVRSVASKPVAVSTDTDTYSEIKQTGEVGLCNLTSFNLVEWRQYTTEEKHKMVYVSLRAQDNLIDYQYYPVFEGEYSNKRNRPIGIGVSNYVNSLALDGISLLDEAAKKWTHEVFEELSYIILYQSSVLAEERGAFETWDQSRWKDGDLPIDWSILAKEHAGRTDLHFDLLQDWDGLREKIKKDGLRFSLHMAIAPTACQTKSGKIRTKKGTLTLEDILVQGGVDYKTIEKNNSVGWYNFKEPIDVQSSDINNELVIKKSTRIYFNGYKPIRRIKFHGDTDAYEFTYNHKLKVNQNGILVWIEMRDITPGMEILSLNADADAADRRKILSIEDPEGLKPTWDIEVQDTHSYLLGNGAVSHNTSGKVIGATESIEPIHDIFSYQDGTITLPTLAPNLRQNRQFYTKAFDTKPRMLIELAAIRQKFIDQSQSINLYYKNPESAKELINDIFYAEELGIKTLYYMKTPKSNYSDACEGCSS